ncbi:hypothetical protein J2S74_001794 [Evansella vedderi]|uniref:NADH dehydrogenase subunit 6 n=1 Tax=Evansella vedderi TaxID=38282 RepID=A0ABT9ZTA0_9BACI|nr:hypothetical protein [Evansella vedderi]MDQ0254419.1 hypothetical protein [Evansella vedderi]
MISFLLFVLFLTVAGLAIGTLIAVKVWYSLPIFLFIIAAFCFGTFWIGVLFGAAFFSWLPVFITKFIIILFCIGLVIYFFRQFHPSYGYFPYRGWIHWALIALFFFLIGLEFASIGLSAWLLLLLLPIFLGAVFGGTILMGKLKVLYRGSSVFLYLPLALFVFLAIFKLL